ncbi:hypothetical protein C8Q80DRAFT_1218884 [Daedaleopsis nitida]|nr:hypothetical protein C8Q80DRAFT_1218884 [Daedaleopsis nitida]
MAILKILCLMASAALYAVAITPPQPRVVSTTVYKGQAYEYIVRSIAYIAGATIMIPTILQTILLIYSDVTTTPPIAPLICPSFSPSTTPTNLAELSSSFLAGLIILFVGALTRLWSYRALGSLFTFEVVITPGHTLVTSGPYAHVRHPAYTGMVLLTAGAYLMHFCEGGYVAECGIERVPALALFGWSWRISSLFGFLSLYRRCAVEDEKLKKEFGGSWLRYRKEVPYALVPYLV